MSIEEFEQATSTAYDECYGSYNHIPRCKYSKKLFQIKMLLSTFELVDEEDRLNVIIDVKYFVERLINEMTEAAKIPS